MKYNDVVISDDIKYIGVDDKDIDILEGQIRKHKAKLKKYAKQLKTHLSLFFF